ncbi:MAG TPA: crossover junction endodeoxyribonuclease RuvC [Candidatus Limnocylindrales bacterium]|nr:crossover junction endodeoxyribonuclease RuvC [Candidatus Limnocylindrales bacterium]
MIILGIDPGTAALGYGIVEATAGRVRRIDHGCLETRPDRPLTERLRTIHALVAELIELHRPDGLAVERLFFSRNAQTAFAVGQARGVVLLAAAQRDLPVREATPSEVKSAVCGDGRADKAAVARMVALVLGMAELPTPDDAADALAIAIWAANRSRTAGPGTSRVLDRAAIAPLETGETPYERAVREAVRRERASGVRERPGTRGPA